MRMRSMVSRMEQRLGLCQIRGLAMPGPCHISNYLTEFLEANGNRVDIKVHPDHRPTPAQMESVRAALRAIPPTHLRNFDQQGGYSWASSY